MMHQKKIAKLKHKVFYKDKPRISNSSDNSKSQKPNILSIPSITKRFDNTGNSRFGGSKKKTLSLHHNLAYVSYSIPLLSSLALLLVLGLSFSPDILSTFADDSTNKAYAAETTDIKTETINVDYTRAGSSNSSLTISAGSGGNGVSSNEDSTMANAGSVAYRSHNVRVQVQDASSYALQISYSYGKDALRYDKADSELAFTGAGGKTPANMSDSTWGFAWGATTATDSTMTYYTVPQFNKAGSELKDGGLEVSTATGGSTIDFTKKLVFAAKFSPTAISGHYVTSVLLSLSATAYDVTKLSELEYMQGITPEICSSSPTGDHKALKDVREPLKTYEVVKLANGDCWMNSNLALDLNGRTLTPADSNVIANWASTTGASSLWSDANGTDDNLIKFFNGTGGTSYNTSYGYYYSFTAATAGSGKGLLERQAPQDICPKGWRLPTRAEFAALNGTYNKTTKTFNLSDGTLSFSPAGYVHENSLTNAGSAGFYWSNTTTASASAAYGFNFSDSGVTKEYGGLRKSGLAVRCMAKRIGEA